MHVIPCFVRLGLLICTISIFLGHIGTSSKHLNGVYTKEKVEGPVDDKFRNSDLGSLGSRSFALHWPEDYEIEANLGRED